MLDIREVKEEDYEKYASLFYFANQQKGAEDSCYFMLDRDGHCKLIQMIDRVGYLYTLWYGNEVSYTQFVLDDEYDLEYAAISKDYTVCIDKVDDDRSHDEFSFLNNKNGHYEDFSFMSRDGVKDQDGFDGVASYLQYDEKSDIRVLYVYQLMTRPNNWIYSFNLINPTQIYIDKKATNKLELMKKLTRAHKGYARMVFDYNKNPLFYSLATMKDQGIIKTILNGSVALNNGANLCRYSRIVDRPRKEELMVSFPFGRQYRLADLNKVIEDYGFNTTVPDEIVEFYNGENKDFQDCLSAANFYKQLYQITMEEVKRLKLELGDSDENN